MVTPGSGTRSGTSLDAKARAIASSLQADMAALTAVDLSDAAVLHYEVLAMGTDWEFQGVFETLHAGVRVAIERGGKRLQANYIPFEFESLPPGFYVYYSKDGD